MELQNAARKEANGHGIFYSLHGAQFCNCTVSWVNFVDFGSRASPGGTVLVTVTSLAGPVCAGPVYTSPPRYGMHTCCPAAAAPTVRQQSSSVRDRPLSQVTHPAQLRLPQWLHKRSEVVSVRHTAGHAQQSPLLNRG